MSWLDLRGTGLSALERLSIEELLLRHDPLERCWGIIGIHEPTENRILKKVPLLSPYNNATTATYTNDDDQCYHDWNTRQSKHHGNKDAPTDNNVYGHTTNEGINNKSCAIIMGIGGKPEKLINIPLAIKDNVLVIKRFSGGGTVVVDHSSLWTTFIGRNDVLEKGVVRPYPREIMEWSANVIFGPAFDSLNKEMILAASLSSSSSSDNGHDLGGVGKKKKKKGKQTLVFQGKSCGLSGGVGESLILPPSQADQEETQQQQQQQQQNRQRKFQLRENDYVLGERKIGGNAQSIVSGGFLHHTSFLWDWDDANMEYLTLPEKRPSYRGDRSHDEFLVRLKDHYGMNLDKHSLFNHVKDATSQSFILERMTLNDVLQIANDKFGGLQKWFDSKCRTKIVKL